MPLLIGSIEAGAMSAIDLLAKVTSNLFLLYDKQPLLRLSQRIGQ
jgi:hypothetical protein